MNEKEPQPPVMSKQRIVMAVVLVIAMALYTYL